MCMTVELTIFYSLNCCIRIIKPQLAIVRLHASIMSVCLSVCLSVAKMQKNAIFSKTKQFRAMVSINDL